MRGGRGEGRLVEDMGEKERVEGRRRRKKKGTNKVKYIRLSHTRVKKKKEENKIFKTTSQTQLIK